VQLVIAVQHCAAHCVTNVPLARSSKLPGNWPQHGYFCPVIGPMLPDTTKCKLEMYALMSQNCPNVAKNDHTSAMQHSRT